MTTALESKLTSPLHLRSRVDDLHLSPERAPGSVCSGSTNHQSHQDTRDTTEVTLPCVDGIRRAEVTDRDGLAALRVDVVNSCFHVGTVTENSAFSDLNANYAPSISEAGVRTDWAYIAVELGASALLAALVAWVVLADWHALNAALVSGRLAVFGG